MRKIMFNDRYGLTQSVLSGIKDMTRRVIPENVVLDYNEDYDLSGIDKDSFIFDNAKYKVGEEVAIAQAYREIIAAITPTYGSAHAYDNLRYEAGWSNKMYVRASIMPHRIRIVNIKLERLQDISDEDVYREGFRKQIVNNGWGNMASHWEAVLTYVNEKGLYKQIRDRNPKEAYSFLIDKIAGIGTWEDNPWVFVYEFELLR